MPEGTRLDRPTGAGMARQGLAPRRLAVQPERTILIIEPNGLARELYGFALRPLECAILHVATGDAALPLVRARAIDLVLMELVLPGRSGLETLAALQDEPPLATVPIIAVSAVSAPQILPPAATADLAAWFVKPIDPSQLLAAVARWLGGR